MEKESRTMQSIKLEKQAGISMDSEQLAFACVLAGHNTNIDRTYVVKVGLFSKKRWGEDEGSIGNSEGNWVQIILDCDKSLILMYNKKCHLFEVLA